MRRAYLDHNATSPLKPAAKAAMLAALEQGGNASSIHAEGRGARNVIEAAREKLAAELGVLPPMVIFTSGGTEANNLALRGAAADRILISAVEHPCVREAARASGKTVELIPVTSDGVIDLAALESLLAKPGTALVSVMAANNETGVLQPIADAARLTHAADGLFHTDAVQLFGKATLRFPLTGADMMTVSAHKNGGPVGAGALIVRDGLPLDPLLVGGGQELRRRAGTENAAAIAGLAASVGNLPSQISTLRDRLESLLQSETPAVRIFGQAAPRLANTSCFALPGLAADIALISLDLDGVAVSSGSACSSGKVGRSHVLAAMGVADELARGAIRVSLGWNSSVEDVDQFIAAWKRAASRALGKAA